MVRVLGEGFGEGFGGVGGGTNAHFLGWEMGLVELEWRWVGGGLGWVLDFE